MKISRSRTYATHLNQYNVIHLCLNDLSDQGDAYENYIGCIRNSIINVVKEVYLVLADKTFYSVSDMLAATDEQFIFLIDEWDYIFSHELFPEHHDEFLEFLRNLLKDQPYVSLAYMTGVLPIKKYSTGSSMNMFMEYTMLKDSHYEEYFGFTEGEVKDLCDRQSELTMDEVLFFLKYNIGEVRDDVIRMVNDVPVRIDIEEEYSAGQVSPRNRKEIYSAMIIYGLLSYHDGELRIPNKELMIEFENALKDEAFGYVAELVRNSDEVLYATLDKKGDDVASYLHNIHNSEVPILKYNDENSLSCVVTLAYLSARNKYRIEREEKSGKGFADFIFYPRRKNLPGVIIELKADKTPEAAIAQIKEKEYAEKLKREQVENILLVGISYDMDKKEHQCVIEDFF